MKNKYNIGDKVWFIETTSTTVKTTCSACGQGHISRVATRAPRLVTISSCTLHVEKTSTTIMYHVAGLPWNNPRYERELFPTLEEAQEECERRNKANE